MRVTIELDHHERRYLRDRLETLNRSYRKGSVAGKLVAGLYHDLTDLRIVLTEITRQGKINQNMFRDANREWILDRKMEEKEGKDPFTNMLRG